MVLENTTSTNRPLAPTLLATQPFAPKPDLPVCSPVPQSSPSDDSKTPKTDTTSETNELDDTKLFKRKIINKKLVTCLYSKSKLKFVDDRRHLDSVVVVEPSQQRECGETKKREVTLFKHEQLGFGFIAGSEKPLIVRFVSPDGPGKDKLLNGDEILSINGENVQFASRDYVISLIRNSSDQLQLIVKQPTVSASCYINQVNKIIMFLFCIA